MSTVRIHGFKVTVPVTRPSGYPTWRQGLTPNTLYDIGTLSGTPTANFSGITAAQITDTGGFGSAGINALMEGGFCTVIGGGFLDNNVMWSLWASGHSAAANAALKNDLGADVPTWQLVRRASPSTSWQHARYYKDGRPVSDHCYHHMGYIPARFMNDGQARVMRWCVQSGYDGTINGVLQNPQENAQVDGFRVIDGLDDPGGTYPDSPYTTYPGSSSIPAVCQDPDTGDAYLVNYLYYLAVFRAATRTWEKWSSLPASPDVWGKTDFSTLSPTYGNGNFLRAYSIGTALGGTEGMASCFDRVRKRVVILQGYDAVAGIGTHLQVINVVPRPMTTNYHLLTTVGANPLSTITTSNCSGMGFDYDWDNDRYLAAFDQHVYAIDPTTYACTDLGAILPSWTLNTVPPTAYNAYYKRWQYYPALHGFVLAPYASTNLRFFPTA